MAENLDDGEFWLPPQFLADDDVAKDKSTVSKSKNDGSLFPSEFPYGFGSYRFSSSLSSPVESLGSSETESDEEEHQHIAELSRKMAHSTLCDGFGSENAKGLFVAGSPQSTLCTFGNCCGCLKCSSHGSPNSGCQLPSPKATWDLLYAAAGEMERMSLSEDGYVGFNRVLMGPTRKPSPVTTLPAKNSNPDIGFYTQQSLSHQQLQLAQFRMLRQQQIAKQQQTTAAASGGGLGKMAGGLYQQRLRVHQMVPNRALMNNEVVGNCGGNNNKALNLSSSAWPSLQQAKQQSQQQFGSGMRAVFLGNPASGKRECAGTGVFLPRRVDSPTESKRKHACSTVLVPDRVAHALNLNLDDMVVGGQAQYLSRLDGNSNMENDAVCRLRGNYIHSQQKQHHRLRPQQPASHYEIRLPQEWTY